MMYSMATVCVLTNYLTLTLPQLYAVLKLAIIVIYVQLQSLVLQYLILFRHLFSPLKVFHCI